MEITWQKCIESFTLATLHITVHSVAVQCIRDTTTIYNNAHRIHSVCNSCTYFTSGICMCIGISLWTERSECKLSHTEYSNWYVYLMFDAVSSFISIFTFISVALSVSVTLSFVICRFFLVWFLKHVKVLPKPEQPERKLTRARECVSHYTLLNIHSSRPIPVFIKVKFMRV